MSFLLIFFSFSKLRSFKIWCGIAGVIFRCCTGYPMGIKANKEKLKRFVYGSPKGKGENRLKHGRMGIKSM